MSELLLEILSEEIPARMINDAAYKMAELMQSELNELACIRCKTASYGSPRRIALVFSDIEIEVNNEVIRGPKTSAPAAAILGFLKKYNLSDTSQLQTQGEFYTYTKHREVDALPELIAKAVENALMKFVWPKSMRWGENEIRWVRPIHSILCILDGKVLPVAFGPIKASNTTRGHRYLNDHSIVIDSSVDYLQKLQAAYVQVDYAQRRRNIEMQIQNILPVGLSLRPDEELLKEVTNLVEWPVVMLGTIADNLMELPPEVLIITLRENQKYLLLNDRDGNLAPYFIIVSNIPGKQGGGQIIDGNQKVLQARLYDAIFFYRQDKKETLGSRVPFLNKLMYHADIGSVYDKVQTTAQMACKLALFFDVSTELTEQAVQLAKADLVTNMVKEFPELQGVMGYYYALNEGIDHQIAVAIKEHYKPRGPSDEVPGTSLGRLISLADKLDSIQQLFAVGIKPTSSKDPFALRRAAIGSIRILQEQGLDLEVLQQLGLSEEVVGFVLERLKFM